MDYLENRDPDEPHIKNLVQLYEEALANNRQPVIDPEAVERIVNYYEAGGHYDKAMQIINSALEQYPYSGLILLKKAQLLFDLKICEDSLECLEKVEIFEPAEVGIYLLKSEILAFQSKHVEALSVLDHAMELADKEEMADVWLHRADVYEDWEKYDEVYRCLKACLLAEDTNEEALSRINYSMEITNRYQDAIELHKSIIDKRPYSYWAWYNLSFAYASLELYEKAIDALEYVVAIDDKVSYAYKDLAQYHHELGNYHKALEAVKDYAAHVKPEADVYLLEGKCFFELDNMRGARYCFRKAIRTNSSSHEAFYNLGMTYIMDGKWKQAFQNLKKALSLTPESMDYLEKMAEVALQLEDYDEARYCCKKAISLNSSYPGIYITLALSYLFDEDLAQALEVVTHGIESCEDDVKLKYIRASLFLLANKRKRAMLEMELLLEDDFDEHEVVFTYFPFLRDDAELQELLDRFESL
ncbi:MAG: tetratricopeptide repeat protein [Bacteroidetes bacterium]|nr:tetratricopeptide repeat protein [Bacteroidota bacterium]